MLFYLCTCSGYIENYNILVSKTRTKLSKPASYLVYYQKHIMSCISCYTQCFKCSTNITYLHGANKYCKEDLWPKLKHCEYQTCYSFFVKIWNSFQEHWRSYFSRISTSSKVNVNKIYFWRRRNMQSVIYLSDIQCRALQFSETFLTMSFLPNTFCL